MKSATFKSLPARKLPKTDREHAVLLGLVELYMKMNRPIGSQTLQENGFESLSTATIRNYFGKMEQQGYLKQQHTSGGRIPTGKAFRLFADHVRHQGIVEKGQEEILAKAFDREGREVADAISRSSMTGSAIARAGRLRRACAGREGGEVRSMWKRLKVSSPRP